MDEELLHRRLVVPGHCAKLVLVESTGSTNTDLLAAAAEPDFAQVWSHTSVLTAEEQTGGRGRLARSWSSPKGASLSTSVVLRPSLPAQQRHWLSLAAGLALVTVLRRVSIPAAMKWPNDVHVHGRKISGILAAVPPQAPDTVVLGCGINVLLRRDQLPTPRSTSVLLELERAETGVPDSDSQQIGQLRTSLLADWLEEFTGLVRRMEPQGDIAPVREEIISVISTVGEQVRVELPDGTSVHGRAVGVQTDGALMVEEGGRRRSFTVGDVFHLR